MADNDPNEYIVPLVDQRYFGAGIRRDRVKFVSASSDPDPITIPNTTQEENLTPGQRYLKIVLGDGGGPETHKLVPNTEQPPPQHTDTDDDRGSPCETCGLCITPGSSRDAHANSLAHQVCIPHTHPPSALSRTRKGMVLMMRSAAAGGDGWDPDHRTGLGIARQGRLFPVKPHFKNDRLGLGYEKIIASSAAAAAVGRVEKPLKLDAGRVRKEHASRKKHAEQLGRMFYGNDDMARYLGEES